MPYVRLRYPLIIVMALIAMSLLSQHLDADKRTIKITPSPKLAPGYYIVLHTKTKLPDDIHAHHENNVTYVGPMNNIKDCHQNRVKIRPLCPGVETELLKVNASDV